jgi:GAF domain-containing protein
VSDRFAPFDPVIEALAAASGEPDPLRLAPEVRGRIETVLDGLRRDWQGLAIGLWRAVPETRSPEPLGRSLDKEQSTEAGRLVLVAFAADASMPADVQAGFRAATGDVSLDQTAFAIVQAVHAGRLVTADAPASETLPHEASSPGWLRRFGARQSAATPILAAGRLLGTFALASTTTIPPGVLAKLDSVAARLAEQWHK